MSAAIRRVIKLREWIGQAMRIADADSLRRLVREAMHAEKRMTDADWDTYLAMPVDTETLAAFDELTTCICGPDRSEVV